MSHLTLYQYGEHWWGEICKKIKRAHLFIDTEAVEMLHWYGGWARLEKAGVSQVSEFSSFETGGEDAKKAVFIVNGPIVNLKSDILREIVRNSHFEYCQVITNASAACHNLARFGDRDVDERKALDELEQEVLEWMGNLNFTCEIFHIPFHVAALAPELFVMPPFSALFPPLEPDLERAKRLWQVVNKGAERVEHPGGHLKFDYQPLESKVCIVQFVQAFHSIFQMLDIKEDIFTMGSFSRLVGEQMEAHPGSKLRRKSAQNRASLIFVDRSLDVASLVDCNFQSALDEIRGSLPRFPGHQNDVQVDMRAILDGSQSPNESEEYNCGCLADSNLTVDGPSRPLTELIGSNVSSLKIKLGTELYECISSSDPPKVTRKDDLGALVETFSGDIDRIEEYLTLLQRSQALILSEQNSSSLKLDHIRQQQSFYLEGLMKRIEIMEFLPSLTKMIRNRRVSDLSLSHILLLITYVYSAIPPDVRFFEEDEDRLQSAFSEALVDDRQQLDAAFTEIMGDQEVDELLAYRTVKQIFAKLKYLSRVRDGLKDYHVLCGNTSQGVRRNNLLGLWAHDLYADDRRDIPDLEHKTGGIGSMFKSGISLLGVSVSKMHPRENPIMIVFVLGGITADEVKQIREAALAKSKAVILVGSTQLSGPWDALRSLFCPNPLFAA